ncbi:MAG: GWxTD domain-containing protein [Gemmatimonadales bacterium]
MRLLSLCRPRAARVVAAFLPLLTACTTWQRVGENPAASPEQQLTQLFNPAALYTKMGRFVSTDQLFYVGSIAFVPGRGDSTLAVVGLSLSNREFAFQRDGTGYTAKYRVEYQLTHPGAPTILLTRDEAIRVASFQETLRTDESILLQQETLVAPGEYQLTVRVRDIGNTQIGTANQKVVAPRFAPGSVTAPILAYEVRGRGSRNDSLNIVLNSRGSVAFGGDTLLVYLEGIGFKGRTSVPLEVRDERDTVIFRTNVVFDGVREIESQAVRIAPDSAPLGQLEIVVGSGAAVQRNSAVVSFSQNWVVTNFDDLVSLLRFFGQDRRLDAMRRAKAGDRVSLWREFYRATDPNLQTPENEALDRYFGLVSLANQRFPGEGVPGWRTDRGEVFVSLGEPDEVLDQGLQQQGRYVRWTYNDLRLAMVFQDVTGFGRFRLTPSSRSDFDRVRVRLQAQAPPTGN